jgi:processive 1,2-diacylglycerol beta-glucosyltransferase
MIARSHLGWTSNGTHQNGSSSTPRILILSASVGAGHLRAAEAIELALRRMAPELYIRNVDVLTLSTLPFRRCYGQMYLDFIDLAPQVLGYFYSLMDRPLPPGPHRIAKLRCKLEKMSMRPFVHLLRAEPWDLVINTHFLPAEIIAWLRTHGQFHTPQVTVTTDFETHRLWVHQPCEHFFTATDEAACYLQSFGVPRSDATATGIPIHPVFSEPRDRETCLARLGLQGDRPIILVLAGGYGVGPLEEIYRGLLDVEVPAEFVVVAGRNTQARKHLQNLPAPARHRHKILGFTKQIDELMAVASLVVSKPGGLSTAETLARGVPLVLVHPVPGQEERNADYLLENGAAIKVNYTVTLALKVEKLLRDPARMAQLRTNARRISRPRAAFSIAKWCLAMLGYRQGRRVASEGRKRRGEGHVGTAPVRNDLNPWAAPLLALR